MKEKIINILKKIYNETNFLVLSLMFFVLAICLFIVTEIIIFGYLLDNDYLIVNTVENMATMKTLPYTEKETLDFFESINNEMQPFFFFYHFSVYSTISFLVLGTFKYIWGKLKHV